jgi:hypothetical protein
MGAPNRSSLLLPDATSEEQPTVRLQIMATLRAQAYGLL